MAVLRLAVLGGAAAVVLLALVLLRTDTRPVAADHLCGNTGSSAGPFKLQTYEPADWRPTYNRTMALAGHNKLFPGLPGFGLPKLETGNRSAGSGTLTDPYIPPTLLKAIAWIESTWTHADWSVAYGEVGPVLVSHDCGYGIMQITSGMQNKTGVPRLGQSMIGGHFAFNIARGARILAEKWNAAPEHRPIVGKRNPTVVETWYYAVWSYNGFVFKNHPLNPDLPFPRPAYKCDGTQPRSNYPYQELVFGCMKNPPVVNGSRLWKPVDVSLPNLSDPAFKLSNWEACSKDSKCAGMDIDTPSPSHKDGASTDLTRAEVIGSPKMGVSKTSVELSAIHGSLSDPVAVAISNPGTGVLSVRIVRSDGWLRVSRRQGVALGTDLGPKNLGLTLRGAATSIPAGTHKGTVKVQSLYPNTTKTIDVTFKVFDLPDGTLIRGSGGTYVMRSGFKRAIPNRATLEANGFDATKTMKVPDSLLLEIPSAKPLLNVLADGNLLKGSGGVYVMEGGKRRAISSLDVFRQCGYSWDAVYRLRDATLDNIPRSPALGGPPCPRVSPPNDTLVTDSSPSVYVMQGGIKRPFTDALTLVARGYRWVDVNRLPDSVMSAIPSGDSVLNVRITGTLLKGSSATYVMENGKKRKIASGAVFTDCGYTSEFVLTVPNAKLAEIGDGASLEGAPCPRYSPPKGYLVTDSGPGVYAMQGGLKRVVPNLFSFSAYGLRWGNVNRLPDAVLADIPTGDALLDVKDDGNLVKGSSSTVYVMEGGLKRPIPSLSVFRECGYAWEAIKRVGDQRLDAVSRGSLVGGPPCPHMSPADGRLVKGSGGTVYMMKGGLKRAVPNPTTFNAWGLKWGNVNSLHDSSLKGIASGHRLLNVLADGNLLKGSGATVYVMEGGVKRPIPSTLVFNDCGYGWDAVWRIADSKLDAIDRGPMISGPPCPQLSPADGTLLEAGDESVYVMEGGLKREVTGAEAFSGCGYLEGNLNLLADSTLQAIPDGEDVGSAPCP